MTYISWNNIQVYKLIRSPNVTRYYRLSQQRRPCAMIDLDSICRMSEFRRYWKETIHEIGEFSFNARDKKGRFAKCVAVIRVLPDWSIKVKDERCPLAIRFRKHQQQIERY